MRWFPLTLLAGWLGAFSLPPPWIEAQEGKPQPKKAAPQTPVFTETIRPLLPSEGGGGEGFDNTGVTLFTTPVLMEKYLEAAELVLGTLLPAAPAQDKAQPANKVETDKLEAVRRKLLSAVPGPKTTPREAAR